MAKTFGGSFSRRGPDILTEELVALLSTKSSFEFKPLFELLHITLRARNFTSGGEEMMRLRVYEKLQSLVSQGAVKKTVTSASKTYKGISAPLLVLSAQMKTLRDQWAARPALAPVVT
jgi:hypothetical protein